MPAPSNPGPGGPASAVSGPGALSRRTDGGPAQELAQLPNAKYGENAAFQQQQQGAPVAQTPGPQQPPQQIQANPAADQVVPLSAPTQRPGEPVTSGATHGPGPGPEALGMNPQQTEMQDMASRTPSLPFLEYVANLASASPASRLLVNLIKANG